MAYSVAKKPWLRYLMCQDAALSTADLTVVTGRVYLQHIVVPWSCIAVKVGFKNVGTSAGSRYVGIYGDLGWTPLGASLLAVSVSTATTGINKKQEIALTTPLKLNPGVYWLVLESSENTSIFSGHSTSSSTEGIYQNYYYDRGGGYGVPTVPCPALTVGAIPVMYLVIQ